VVPGRAGDWLNPAALLPAVRTLSPRGAQPPGYKAFASARQVRNLSARRRNSGYSIEAMRQFNRVGRHGF